MLISLSKRYDERGFFFLSFPCIYFLTHQNSEQGLQRSGLEESNTFCIMLVNYLLCIPAANPLSVQKYSCNPGDILVKSILSERAESDSKTGKLLPLGSRAETTNISKKCQNSYAREEITQNRDSARNWGLRHSVRYKTLTSTWTKKGKQCWGNKLYKLQLAALGRLFGDGVWGLATYVQHLFNRVSMFAGYILINFVKGVPNTSVSLQPLPTVKNCN